MFISCVPSKATPLILRAFASLLAATAVPFDGRAFAALFTVSRKPRFQGCRISTLKGFSTSF
ncbi:hypothetical protein ACUW7S_002031 [Escherichia coli]|uniref:hypothetical protein n=1 Tax=Escherichia coli TaxID=562 RepID=UPI000267096B|nr:hypothetical protein [Escherichia coli]MED6495677.1 hypothetical protein [Escherichia coli O157]EFI4033749.1 hypothetical protein [Escherichia coli]EFI4505762.1 hypothetical protein [Escherichia coli]EFI7919252.1 hypothetical protein [Escherichia coli]EFI9319581.1 hypothetical protein [Escherichia coli]